MSLLLSLFRFDAAASHTLSTLLIIFLSLTLSFDFSSARADFLRLPCPRSFFRDAFIDYFSMPRLTSASPRTRLPAHDADATLFSPSLIRRHHASCFAMSRRCDFAAVLLMLFVLPTMPDIHMPAAFILLMPFLRLIC